MVGCGEHKHIITVLGKKRPGYRNRTSDQQIAINQLQSAALPSELNPVGLVLGILSFSPTAAKKM
jgi:hypothetical protein